MTIMAKNLLIVEGGSDKDFIKEFLRIESLDIDLIIEVATAPEIDNSISHTSKQAVFQSLTTVVKQLNDGRLTRIGVLIDMDYTLDSLTPIKQQNIHQLSKALNPHGFVLRHQTSDAQGLFFDNNDFDNPLGVWMMPDNEQEGYLEHWIKGTIRHPQQSHFTKAKQFIESFDPPYFKPTATVKAEIYTWLAIQPKPSQDLSRCLSPKYDLLDKNAPSYQNFRNWLLTTFS